MEQQNIKPNKDYIIEDFDRNLLTEGAEELGITLSEEQIGQFEKYYYFLLTENKKYNLTGLKTCKDVILKHFVDSLTIAPLLDTLSDSKALSMIDIGTGAGFPAVPIQIVRPDNVLTLLDSNNKKIKFLDLLKEELGLKYETIWSRAEDYQKKAKSGFDIVLMRGVGTMRETVGYAMPFARSKGYFITQKSVQSDAEIEESKQALSRLHSKLYQVLDLTLPVSFEPRRLVVVRKD